MRYSGYCVKSSTSTAHYNVKRSAPRGPGRAKAFDFRAPCWLVSDTSLSVRFLAPLATAGHLLIPHIH